ncbi:MAG: LysR family transcriptional regulator [Oscillospiraceae bacterium]|nr:LysR family transcriptional regulator [Oscillospiraceae bacterium]
MDVRQLKYFIAVCDAGSFSAAAEKLFISQQGLSMAVLRLEKELSCTLLKRTAAGVELTEQGEYLLPKAKEIVAAVVACEGHFEELRRRKTTVEVACAYGVMGEFAGQMIRDFQAKNPTFRVTMGEYPDLLCEEAVMEGQAELGFAIAPVDAKSFDVRPLQPSAMCLVVHESHPMARRKQVALRDFKGMPLMVMNESFKMYHNVVARCRELGFEPDFSIKAGEASMLYKLLSPGSDPAISVDFVCRDMHRPDAVAIPIDDHAIDWQPCLIRRKGEELSAPAAAFWRFVNRSARGGDAGELGT